MKSNVIGSGVAVVLSLLAAPKLQAQAASSSPADVEYGRYLSSECLTCHQASGIDSGIPSITGWDEHAFIEVLVAYRKRLLPNRVMRNIAANLDDDQIKALAAFFATLPSSVR